VPSRAEVRAQAAQRRATVLRLRLGGYQFQQIGDMLDPPCSMQRAHQLYLAALAQIVREPAEELVKADCERIDMLWRIALTHALQGSARWAEVALRCLERRARMLGLDAPTRSEVRMSVEEVDELDREIEQLLAAQRGLDPPR
jgi:hypothetical protein